MTRAVGDLFGTSGIADEMIRFNGYPYLDKEEHGFNIPGMIMTLWGAGSFINCWISFSSNAQRSLFARRHRDDSA